MIRRAYLTLYNAVQAGLWSICLWHALQPYIASQFAYEAGAEAFNACKRWVEFGQAIAFLEVLHPLLGITGGSVGAALMQWAGRSNVLFVILRQSSEAASSPLSGLLALAWALSEVIRYPWALLTTLKACPHALLWLRYTAFILLYPVGFVSEALLIFEALPELRLLGVGVYPLPNPFNLSFDYPLLMKALVYAYPALSLQMYTYMLAQRRKKLAAPKEGPQGQAAEKKRK